MTTLLVAITVLVVGWLVLGAIFAVWSSSSRTGKKRVRAQAQVLLAQVPKGAFGLLLPVFSAFRLSKAEEANLRVRKHESEADILLDVLARPRDGDLSAGGFGDRLNLTVWETQLVKQGYSDKAAAIIAAVYHHHLEDVLDELIEGRRWDVSRSASQSQTSHDR